MTSSMLYEARKNIFCFLGSFLKKINKLDFKKLLLGSLKEKLLTHNFRFCNIH